MTFKQTNTFGFTSIKMSDVADIDEELGGCELGTKEYWEDSYLTEINNYKAHGDVGEVWFDEDSQFRVIAWMGRNDIESESKIIDLGVYITFGHRCFAANFVIEFLFVKGAEMV